MNIIYFYLRMQVIGVKKRLLNKTHYGEVLSTLGFNLNSKMDRNYSFKLNGFEIKKIKCHYNTQYIIIFSLFDTIKRMQL